MSGLLESLKLMYAHDATVLAGIENGSVRGIPLTRGMIAMVDADDYKNLATHKWYALKGPHTFYAVRLVGPKRRRIPFLMHRDILGLVPGDGKIIDHRNKQGLDNRRVNLRIASLAINMCNRRMMSTNSSGYHGVGWHKRSKKWRASITFNQVHVHGGCYTDIKTAAVAYDRMAVKHWGEDALLNFPERRDEYVLEHLQG